MLHLSRNFLKIASTGPMVLCSLFFVSTVAVGEPPAYKPTIKRAYRVRKAWVGKPRTFTLTFYGATAKAARQVQLQCKPAVSLRATDKMGPLQVPNEALLLVDWFFCQKKPVDLMLAYSGHALLATQRSIGVRGDDFTLNYGVKQRVVISQRRGRLMGLTFLGPKKSAPSTWGLRATWEVREPVMLEEPLEKKKRRPKKVAKPPSRVLLLQGGRPLFRLEEVRVKIPSSD